MRDPYENEPESEVRIVRVSRVLAAKLTSMKEDSKPLREIVYRCRGRRCERTWIRITERRMVETVTCPFCGRPGRMVSSKPYEGTAHDEGPSS